MPQQGSEHIDIFIILLSTIVAFLAYWLVIENPAVQTGFRKRHGERGGPVRYFVFNKLWGVVCFGMAAAAAVLTASPRARTLGFGLGLPAAGTPLFRTFLWSAGLSAIFILMNWLRARKLGARGGDFGRYPEIRVAGWSARTVALDLALWSLYLVAYELVFRGTLLLPLAASLGPWPAIGVNVALYSADHVPKGPGEAIGAQVLGFVLCIITLDTGSALTAVIVHIALAVSNDLFAAVYHPRLGFPKNTTKEAGL